MALPSGNPPPDKLRNRVRSLAPERGVAGEAMSHRQPYRLYAISCRSPRCAHAALLTATINRNRAAGSIT
jgi:hypothetical protein